MKLYLVPTPVGNLEDMTFRAVRVLKEVDQILAEDTRTSSVLLHHYGITTPVHPHHKFNEHRTVSAVVSQIKSGMVTALITDAGTPGISDPGFLLVRACVAEGIDVECLPGATAFVPAIVNSGLPCDRFYFEGFLPQKKGRQSKIDELAKQTCTMILYESPYRVVKTLAQLAASLGCDRQASVSREISKMHEETVRGTLGSLTEHFTTHPPKGEFVIVVAGRPSKASKASAGRGMI